jgi:heme exporter protein D
MSIWWNSWSDFWAMGRHGVYVWGSYGIAAAFVLAEIVQARAARHRMLADVRQELAAQDHPGDGA